MDRRVYRRALREAFAVGVLVVYAVGVALAPHKRGYIAFCSRLFYGFVHIKFDFGILGKIGFYILCRFGS